MPKYLDEICTSCEEQDTGTTCPKSKRPCGHHCNHIWSHEECCWCGLNEGLEEGEEEENK